MVQLYEEEDLRVERPRYEEILAYSYAQMGREEEARSWVGRAMEGWRVVGGEGSWEVRRVRELWADVRGHGSWGGEKR